MNRDALAGLLERVAAGALAPGDALAALRDFPTADLSFAQVDHHRVLRQGVPEVIFCEGKHADHLLGICTRLAEAHGGFLGTRATPEQAARVRERFPAARYHPVGRVLHLPAPESAPPIAGTVCVVTAGTSDLPVAEEAAVVGEAIGLEIDRLTDVGVAGIHRVLNAGTRLREAAVVIVVAGMEGALPSVVGGLVACPVIAVPTSVGYGASFQGLAALLGMLNSCAAGVTVVNIDNGFGAAAAAARILLPRTP